MGFFHMYAATNKGMRDGLQPSSKESGEEDASQAEQNKRREEEGNSAGRNRIGHFQITRPVAMNNSFAPLRDLPMENAETGSGRNSTKTPGTNENSGKGRPPLILLTSETTLIKLQRELKSVVGGELLLRNMQPEPG
jgi:hypothetical protein